MHLQLNNLSDKELLLRFRKFREREAAGVLLERYSHLLVAVCLPGLDAQHPADTVFPDLTVRLYNQMQGATGKMNDTIHETVQQYFGKIRKGSGPQPAVRELEYRIEQAGSNPIEKTALAVRLENALGRLIPEDSELLNEFYLEHITLREIARRRNTAPAQIRERLRGIRQMVAGFMKEAAYE